MSFVEALLDASVRIAIPLALAAMGGLLAERAGVFNIGLEGMMLFGAFGGVTASYFLHSAWLGVLATLVVGAALGLLLGLFCITLKGDQIVVGIMLNVLCLGMTSLLFRSIFGDQGQTGAAPRLHDLRVPGLADIPVVGAALFDDDPLTYITFGLVALLTVVLFQTRRGLRWRAAGDAPAALDDAGISVPRTRYVAVMCSGMLAALGGAHLTLAQTSFFSDGMTNGRGFIALGAIIVGRWHPVGALGAALLFAVAEGLHLRLQASGVNVPYQLLGMLPYLLTIAVLAGFMGRSRAPAFLGRPFNKGDA